MNKRPFEGRAEQTCRETVTSLGDAYCVRTEYPKMARVSHANPAWWEDAGWRHATDRDSPKLLKSLSSATSALFGTGKT